MLKYLLLFVVVAVVLAWARGARRPAGRDDAPLPPKAPAAPPAPAPMVACAHCGTHLPRAEALFDVGGHPYCGETHRRAGPVR